MTGVSGGGYVPGVTEIPEHRRAQERLWRAITLLDAIDQPGAQVDLDRSEAELELVVAWSEYELVRSGVAS